MVVKCHEYADERHTKINTKDVAIRQFTQTTIIYLCVCVRACVCVYVRVCTRACVECCLVRNRYHISLYCPEYNGMSWIRTLIRTFYSAVL